MHARQSLPLTSIFLCYGHYYYMQYWLYSRYYTVSTWNWVRRSPDTKKPLISSGLFDGRVPQLQAVSCLLQWLHYMRSMVFRQYKAGKLIDFLNYSRKRMALSACRLSISSWCPVTRGFQPYSARMLSNVCIQCESCCLVKAPCCHLLSWREVEV